MLFGARLGARRGAHLFFVFISILALVTWAFFDPSPPALMLQCLFLYWFARDLSLFTTSTSPSNLANANGNEMSKGDSP